MVEFKDNPDVKNCITKIDNGNSVLENLRIDFNDSFILKNYQTVYFYKPKITDLEYVACFDFRLDISIWRKVIISKGSRRYKYYSKEKRKIRRIYKKRI